MTLTEAKGSEALAAQRLNQVRAQIDDLDRADDAAVTPLVAQLKLAEAAYYEARSRLIVAHHKQRWGQRAG